MRLNRNWTTAVLRATRDLTPDIREFTLVPTDGATAYPTGSHLQVRVLIEGRSDLRHYSLIGETPRNGAWRIAVKRASPGRGGSHYMWSLAEGARLEVSHPDSHFQLSGASPFTLLVAGGIGITPLIGMAEALRRRGASYRLLYAGRSRGQMAYCAELAATHADAVQVLAHDEGMRVDLPSEIDRLPRDAEAYVCGPISLLEAMRAGWQASGRARDQLIYETFGSSGRFATEPFTVRIPRLGFAATVPVNSTILDVLEAAGVGVLHDCRRGECGLCQLDVLELTGTLDHRDVFFSAQQHAEGRKLCACVSRVGNAGGHGDITLDPAFRGDGRLMSGPELRKPAPV